MRKKNSSSRFKAWQCTSKQRLACKTSWFWRF